MDTATLTPAAELARHDRRLPNESAQWRKARTALLAEELELRRHIERVAAQRRALPLGGEVPENYEFVGENGPGKLSQMFDGKKSLVVYNWMYGPERVRPCPMCSTMLTALDGEAADIMQRVALAIVARSPIERLLAFKAERGWKHLKIHSSAGNDYNRTYVHEDPNGGAEADAAGFNVFTKQGDKVFHTWGDEMDMSMADPGQDPRGAPDIMPMWTIFDMTREGRAADWYPKLSYPA